MDQWENGRLEVQTAQQDDLQSGEWLFTLPAFYAEYAPLPPHSSIVDHIYVLKDCGVADRRSASVCLAFHGTRVHLSQIS
jgi:hypothetical protein